MCGIAALFARKNSSLPSLLIQEMTNLIRHRGPDDEGFVLFSSENTHILGGKDTPKNVYHSSFSYSPKQVISQPFSCHLALGHRRLSILDLSPAGHQPLCSEEVWITYNGEIYNFIEIRKELESLGHNFRTNTDTEVILKAYREWGNDFLHKLNGMFAFVLFDQKKQKVLAVRDRFGVKPLYYWISPKGFLAIASEIKQFTVLPGWGATLNAQCAYDFLNWGVMDHTSETFFSGVHQVKGGEFLEFSTSQLNLSYIKPKRWYSLEGKTFQGSLEEAGQKFHHLLEDSIKLRLRADVDVGSCLSGGLDSSSIVCLGNKYLREKNGNGKQKTFSACSEVPRFDERSFIDIVVNATSVESHYVYPSIAELFKESRDIVWYQDEPFASTSIYAQWLVFKLAKENHIKVMLDGQGADEQLAGYHGFFGNRFYDLFCSLRWKTLYDEMKISGKNHASLRSFLLLLNKLVPNPIRQPLRKWFGKSSTRPNWLNFDLLNVNDRDPAGIVKNKTVEQQSRLQLLQTSLPMLLHYEDRDSMAHSIESRTPFLDYRLVEFNLGLHSDLKIANGWTKQVLRQSMKGILPEEIRLRKDKLGFVTAEEVWLKKENPEFFLQEIDQAIASAQGILQPSLKDDVQEMISGKRAFSYLPWRVISFGHWLQKFSVKI